MAEKDGRGMEGRAVNLDTGGNGSPCLGATDHDDTHVTILLFRGRASGTGLVRQKHKETVTISRQCQALGKSQLQELINLVVSV